MKMTSFYSLLIISFYAHFQSRTKNLVVDFVMIPITCAKVVNLCSVLACAVLDIDSLCVVWMVDLHVYQNYYVDDVVALLPNHKIVMHNHCRIRLRNLRFDHCHCADYDEDGDVKRTMSAADVVAAVVLVAHRHG